MVTSKVRVAGEIVSYCRSCNLDLTHIVVAMVGGVPKRVKCLTCQKEHAFHRPLEDRSSSQTPGSRAPREHSAKPARASASRAAPESESSREREWGSRIAGQPASAFALYRPVASFEQDQLLRHSKFGDGYVVRVIDPHKIEVMFQDGPRTLAQGLAAGG